MARKTCGKPNGHADAADKRTQGLEAEIARVNDKYNALLLERRAECDHDDEAAWKTVQYTNHRLVTEHGRVVAMLNARILELERQLAPYHAADREAAEQRRKKAMRFG